VWTNHWGQHGFNLAREALGLEKAVEDRQIDVMELSPNVLTEDFDVVLFLGVLYHLSDPLGALERVASVTKDLLILETETALDYLPFPAARLWRPRELSNDDTNYWSLNRRAITATLRRLGFGNVRVVYHTSIGRRFARAIRDRRLRDGFRSCRVVIHARR